METSNKPGWWQVCAGVLRGAQRALDEPVDEPPSPEALEFTQFVLRELAPLRGQARAWAPPTPEGRPVWGVEDLHRSLGHDSPGHDPDRG